MTKKILILLLIFSSYTLKAELGFEFLAGISTPSEQIGDVYNSNLKLPEVKLLDYLYGAAKIGYHIGAKVRIPIHENFMFTTGAFWNRFPQTSLQIIIPKASNPTLADTVFLKSFQNIIPLNIGINAYLLRDIFGIYFSGDLTYNYIQNTVDYDGFDVPIPLNLDLKPSNNRVGSSLGLGLDVNIELVTLNIEGKYHFANLIGKEENEPQKNYFTLTFGVVFGGN